MKEYLKSKIDDFELTPRSKISEICIGSSMILKWVTSPEVI